MCPLCNSEKIIILYSNLEKTYRVDLFGVHKKLSIKQCLSCKIVFTDPQLEHKELGQYFKEDYGSFQIYKKTKGLSRYMQSFIKKTTLKQYFGYGKRKWWRFLFYPFKIPLAHYPQKQEGGKVLDIGCGSGSFLVCLKELGWDAYGVDPSLVAVETARKQGISHVYHGDLLGARFQDNSFDAITMFHVFEHISNPKELLKEIKRILKPGGSLIIGIPNFQSWGSKLFGKYWAGLSFPLHCFHYNYETLVSLLRQYQFSITDVSYANILSDIIGSSPENMIRPSFSYNLPLFLKKIFQLSNIAGIWVDYFFGNIMANIFKSGAQITVIGKNNK